ncbi:unnamed protein product [Closterium sp. Yama58-4]|nr:unnamed protein product [Closterium sp. Yama58-4]
MRAAFRPQAARRRFLVPSASTGSAAGAGDTDGGDSIERKKEAGKPKAVDPEILEAGKVGETGPRSRDGDVARSADVAGDADMDLEALARELNMDLKEVQEAERMFESAMSAVASLESLSAKFDQMILETAAAESAGSEDSNKGLRGFLGEGGLANAGLEDLERGMEELVKEFEAASSKGERKGISQSGEGSAEEADDDGADVDLAEEAIADMENDLAELQRSVAATLAELDRTATSLTPELGLQEVLKLKSSISADVAQIEQQTGAILGLLREARELQEASQQPGAPMGARQLAAQRAVEARNAMAAMAGSAEAAAEALKALEEEGAADWDGVGGPAYLSQWHEVAAKRAEIKRELAEMFSNALVPPFPVPPLSSQPAYLPQWHEVAAERAELKRELAEMFSNAVQLFQEGDAEGAMALVAANEAEVMGQEGDEEGAMALVAANEAEVMGQVRDGLGADVAVVVRRLYFSLNSITSILPSCPLLVLSAVPLSLLFIKLDYFHPPLLPPSRLISGAAGAVVAAGEAGVEQSAVLLALSQLLLGMGEEGKGRQLMDQVAAAAGDGAGGQGGTVDGSGEEHYLQASTLCSLANALMEAQRHEEAEEVQRKAAELYEAARGERSRGVATMLVRLTQIQMEGGRVEEAEGSILRAKDILIEKEGLTSMEAAIVEFTLAQVRQAQGRPDLAVGVLESGLRIFEQAVEQQRRKGAAGDDAELAGAGAELAWGDDELAGTPRALVNALGASAFPAFEQAQIELSMLYDILDRDEDACAIREKLLSAKELAIGPLSPALVPPLIQLAQSRMTVGQSEGAERLLRRALQIARSAVPAGDARLAVPIERLALCLAQMERFEEAEVLAREHLMIAEGAVEKAGLRGDSVEMLAQRNLALVLMATDRAEAAELLLRKALARMEGAVGPMGDAALVIAGSLVVNLQQQGRDDEAEPLLKRLALAEAAATGNLYPFTSLRNATWHAAALASCYIPLHPLLVAPIYSLNSIRRKRVENQMAGSHIEDPCISRTVPFLPVSPSASPSAPPSASPSAPPSAFPLDDSTLSETCAGLPSKASTSSEHHSEELQHQSINIHSHSSLQENSFKQVLIEEHPPEAHSFRAFAYRRLSCGPPRPAITPLSFPSLTFFLDISHHGHSRLSMALQQKDLILSETADLVDFDFVVKNLNAAHENSPLWRPHPDSTASSSPPSSSSSSSSSSSTSSAPLTLPDSVATPSASSSPSSSPSETAANSSILPSSPTFLSDYYKASHMAMQGPDRPSAFAQELSAQLHVQRPSDGRMVQLVNCQPQYQADDLGLLVFCSILPALVFGTGLLAEVDLEYRAIVRGGGQLEDGWIGNPSGSIKEAVVETTGNSEHVSQTTELQSGVDNVVVESCLVSATTDPSGDENDATTASASSCSQSSAGALHGAANDVAAGCDKVCAEKAAQLKPALKGSSPRPSGLRVTWAADVYDPIPSLISHTVGRRNQRKIYSRRQRNEHAGKGKHGKGSKSSKSSKKASKENVSEKVPAREAGKPPASCPAASSQDKLCESTGERANVQEVVKEDTETAVVERKDDSLDDDGWSIVVPKSHARRSGHGAHSPSSSPPLTSCSPPKKGFALASLESLETTSITVLDAEGCLPSSSKLDGVSLFVKVGSSGSEDNQLFSPESTLENPVFTSREGSPELSSSPPASINLLDRIGTSVFIQEHQSDVKQRSSSHKSSSLFAKVSMERLAGATALAHGKVQEGRRLVFSAYMSARKHGMKGEVARCLRLIADTQTGQDRLSSLNAAVEGLALAGVPFEHAEALLCLAQAEVQESISLSGFAYTSIDLVSSLEKLSYSLEAPQHNARLMKAKSHLRTAAGLLMTELSSSKYRFCSKSAMSQYNSPTGRRKSSSSGSKKSKKPDLLEEERSTLSGLLGSVHELTGKVGILMQQLDDANVALHAAASNEDWRKGSREEAAQVDGLLKHLAAGKFLSRTVAA